MKNKALDEAWEAFWATPEWKAVEEANKAEDEADEAWEAFWATPAWKSYEKAWNAALATPEYEAYEKAGGTCKELRRELNNEK